MTPTPQIQSEAERLANKACVAGDEAEFSAAIKTIATALMEARQAALEWQPIDTAPRDATAILLFHERFGIVQGWYAPLEISHDHEGNDNSEGDLWVLCDDAIEVEVEHHDNRYWDGPVTHWMPLPQPPDSK